MSTFTYSSPFPSSFVLGVAAASAQIEGAAFVDGKGESIWDHFARIPGKVAHGDNLDVACDHYHRFDEDFALMASLGVKHYRLSIAWPRIYPKGDGPVNPAGLDFYRRLLASMARHGITPWVTLFHWDLPQALEERGGWTSRATVDAFARYAATVVKEFGGLVKNWITLNEIRCFTFLAYEIGTKAPGRKEAPAVVNQTYHHALLAHGHAVRAVREFGGAGARVGADAPKVEPGDFDLISAPTDFLGLNIYTATYVRAGRNGQPYEALALPKNYPRADSVWLNLVPQAIYWAPRMCHELYGHPSIYITENGCGYDDEPVVDGEVIDLHRRDYLRNHLREVHRGIADGVPIDGYFLWSFIDNYEWEDGYQRRFGIVHCDFETLKRTPKLSARYYAEVIRTRTVV
jgi:beta-glucosidase